MPSFVRADYDAALAEAIDTLPEWALAALSDGVIRVEQAPRPGGLEAERGLRVVVYREPTISRATSDEELRRLVRADLVRALVWHFDLTDRHVRELTA
jgi:predicted Zn-dependent protease with MMP-like domain